MIGMKEDLSPTDVTIDRGNLGRGLIRSWDKKSSQRRSSDARQLGCVFLDVTPPKSILRKGTGHAETDPTCEIHKGYCASN